MLMMQSPSILAALVFGSVVALWEIAPAPDSYPVVVGKLTFESKNVLLPSWKQL